MRVQRKRNKLDETATLRAAMQDALRKELRTQYQPEPEIPHGLMVLLMQMNDGPQPSGRSQSSAV